MGRYTIELRHIKDNLFDFDYNFYDEEQKTVFEHKFTQRFLFNEIGFETIDRFKNRLQELLNRKYPYYRQIYETELRCKDIDFMLNKDLKEKYISETINLGSTNTNDNTTTTSTGESIAKNLDFPHGKVSNIDDGYMSNASKDNSNSTDNSNTSTETNSENTTKTVNEVLSQGNIGVTSSAELLEKWRRVIINIDELILQECEILFMGVY